MRRLLYFFLGVALLAPVTHVTAQTAGGYYLPKQPVNKTTGMPSFSEKTPINYPITGRNILLNDWQLSSPTLVDYFSRGFQADAIGGITTIDNITAPRSMLITTSPYGNYANGCGLGVAMVGEVASPQYPVSESDPRGGGAAVIASGQYDSVANCTLVANSPSPSVLAFTSASNNNITLAQPLTEGQANALKPYTYITTNITTSNTDGASTTGTLPTKNLYSAFVAEQPNAGDTVIKTYGFAVPGQANTSVSTLPTTLDTVWSAYSNPVLFFGVGAAQSAFAHNWFFSVNSDDLTPSTSTKSMVHQFTPIEIDLNIGPGTAPKNSVWWQGIAMNAGNQPDALTSNSQQMFLGGNINHHLIVNGGAGNWDIEADGLYVPVAHDGIGPSNSSQVSSVWEQWINGANRIQTVLYDTIGNPSNPLNWQQAVVHFGPRVDGTPTQTGDMKGSLLGEIQFNEDNQLGGLSLCGYGINCGFTVTNSGHSLIRAGSDNQTQLVFQPYDNSGNPYISADNATNLSIKNSLGSGVVLTAFQFDGNLNSDHIQLTSNGSIYGSSSTGNQGYGATLQFTDAGNIVVGTQVSGGANVSGINQLSATSAVINGNDLSKIINTDYLTTNDSLVVGGAIYNGTTKVFTSQGTYVDWNGLFAGSANTDFVNVSPTSTGGFAFYNVITGSSITDQSNYSVLINGAGLTTKHLFATDDSYLNKTNIQSGGIFFTGNSNANAAYLTMSSDGTTLQLGTQVSGGGNFNGINTLGATNVSAANVTAATITATKQLNLTNITASAANKMVTGSVGTVLYCTNCISQNNTSGTPMPIYWTGQTWADGLGKPVTNLTTGN